MEISWFEIVAQIINFFVLLAVLQWLFYTPITKAMADRKERIEEAEKIAHEKTSEADAIISEYNEKVSSIETDKKEILDDYRDEAEEEKEKLLQDYQDEAEQKRKQFFEEVEDEKTSFIKKIQKDLGKQAVNIASKILSTISSKELEEEIFNSFIEDLDSIHERIPEKELINNKKNLNVVSARALTEFEIETITKALHRNMSQIDNIYYDIDEDLILGYELSLETYTINNNIRTYLNEVEENIIEILEEQKP